MSTTNKSIDVTDAGHISFASADSVAGSIKRNHVSIGALNSLIQTRDNLLPLIARVALGIVMFPHGAQKVFGWFGGHGFMGSMSFFTDKIHVSAPLAFLAIFPEFAGSLGLITGCLSRIAAFGIACNMVCRHFHGSYSKRLFHELVRTESRRRLLISYPCNRPYLSLTHRL